MVFLNDVYNYFELYEQPFLKFLKINSWRIFFNKCQDLMEFFRPRGFHTWQTFAQSTIDKYVVPRGGIRSWQEANILCHHNLVELGRSWPIGSSVGFP
jgi:hypothetical protein